MRSATVEELSAIHGVGDVVAGSLVNWMKNPTHKKQLDDVLVHLTIENPVSDKRGKLEGKTFVFTGTLPTLARSDAQEMARKEGAHIANSVSKNTDYVVIGSDPGSKAERAQKLGVTILNEAEFVSLLNMP